MAHDRFQNASAAAGQRPPIVPEHELLRKIGEGAYGEVWLARSITGAMRAVKIVYHAHFTDDRPYEREFNGITKFEPLSRSNEGLVDILQVGRDDQAQCFYYVMELADSLQEAEPSDEATETNAPPPRQLSFDPAKYVARTLRADVQRRGRLPCRDCVQLGMSLSLALGHLHRHGLLHRDVKPSNIIFVGGVPKLADIGLVTEQAEARSYVGTEGFIPPDGPNSPQADLYSLGKVLYEASMGKDRQEFPEPRTAVLDDPEAPALLELNAVVVKACASDRRERYQSAEEMHADLALLYSGRSVKRKHLLERRVAWMSKVGPLITVVAVLATGAYLVQRRQTTEIRRLARAESVQRQRAEAALGQADQNFTELEQERAEEDFAADRAPSGLAGLAHLVRTHPTNRVAAERLLAALTQRNFLLPALPGLALNTNVTAVEFSADGRFLLIGCVDASLHLWDTRDGGLSNVPGCGAILESAAFDERASRMVVLGRDHVARFLDVARREYVSPPLTNAAGASLLDLSEDGHWLAAASLDGSVCVWDLETRQEAGPPIAIGQSLTHIRLSPDGESLFTTTSNFVSRIWRTRTGQPRSPPLQGLFWLEPSFSPDGRLLLLCSEFAAGVVWNAETFARTGSNLTHQTWLSALHFSPDGQRVVTGSGDRTTRVWDAHTGESLTPPMLHRALVHIARFSPEGRRLLVTTYDGIVRLWDAQTGLPSSEPLALGNLQLAQFSPDGERILVVTGSRRLLLLDARPTRAAARFLQNEQTVRMAGFSPDDSQLLCVNFSPTAMLWNLRTHPAVPVPLRHGGNINSGEFSPDGRLIATAGEDRVVRIWEAATGRIVGEPLRQDSSVNSVQFDATGKRLMIGAADGTARVWDIESGQAQGRPMKHSGQLRAAVFSSDGKCAITQAEDNAVRIWRLGPEPTLIRGLRHEGAVGFLKSRDGKRLATFSVDQTARVWDAYSESSLSPVLKHNDAIVTAGFSPDGQRLVTGCRDGTARMWDVASGKSVAMLHEGTVKVAWFSPDGRRIVTGCDDGVARLWDADSGQPASEPLPQKSDINSARFTSDGQWLATVSADGVARIWEMLRVTNAAPAWLPDLAEAVANKRLVERRVVLTADDQAIWRVRQAIAASTRDDEFTCWAKWFFAPREQRPFCPGARLTHADWVEECLNAGSPQSLHEALEAALTEPLPIATLVLNNLTATSTNSAALAGTEWLSRYATQRWPNCAAVWKAQAEVLRRKGSFQEALLALQRALDLHPDPSLCFLKSQMLEGLGELAAAAQACASGLCLLSNSPAYSPELRQRLSFQQINALRQLGRHEEALSVLAAVESFPVRDPHTPSNAVDLTLCFNARLDEDWHRRSDKGNNLASLTPGLLTLEGIPFDVRGVVQVTGQIRDLDPIYPERVGAIAVGRSCRQLHLLHGTGWVVPEGTTIANWIIHWVDGGKESVPIVYGRDVRNWHFWPTMPQESGGAQPVWKGPQARWKDKATSGVRLYQTTWQNPRVDIPVASIDFVSAGAPSAPFLLAITAE